MLGDDVFAAGDAIHRLWSRMQAHGDVDLITGVYWTKTHPTHPYIWRDLQRGPYLDWRMGEWFPVDFAGCDCLLVRLSDRMQALGPEWFSTSWVWDDGDTPVPGLNTEDFYFYTKAREAGIRLWCDTNVQCLHEDRHSRELYGLTSDMPQAGATPPTLPDAGTDAAPKVKIADLGSGRDTPWWGDGTQVQVDRFDGDENLRPTYRCDLRSLPVPDQFYDLVHARHVLEHFGRDEVPGVLREWLRVLRVGGRLQINVPNLAYAAQGLLAMEAGEVPFDQYVGWQLYGEQASPYDYHKTGFTVRILRRLLEQVGGLDEIEVRESDGAGHNLEATAVKREHKEPYAIVPHWDAIMASEGVAIQGVQPKEASAETPTVDVETVDLNGWAAEQSEKYALWIR
jgi:predicted SAM-dependent methyltransferase